MFKISPVRLDDGDIPEINGASSSMGWFAAYTVCRHEKRVAQHLDQRGIEHYLPLYKLKRNWRDGSIGAVDLPLFPGYLFVRMNRTLRLAILNVPGIVTIVSGTGGEPARLADTAINALRSGVKSGTVAPHPLLTIGDRVMIRSGALAGMEGILAKKKSGLRVVLTIEQIMQSISIEVSEEDLEPVEAARPLSSLSRPLVTTYCG